MQAKEEQQHGIAPRVGEKVRLVVSAERQVAQQQHGRRDSSARLTRLGKLQNHVQHRRARPHTEELPLAFAVSRDRGQYT